MSEQKIFVAHNKPCQHIANPVAVGSNAQLMDFVALANLIIESERRLNAQAGTISRLERIAQRQSNEIERFRQILTEIQSVVGGREESTDRKRSFIQQLLDGFFNTDD
jgi:hypothetical protein